MSMENLVKQSIEDQPHLYNEELLPSPAEALSHEFLPRFIIATKNDALSSGFPFHERLLDLKVSPDEWHRFSNDIVHAGKMTLKEYYAAWGTGVATGLLTSPVLHILGPVVGYYAGKHVHKRVIVTKVKERLEEHGDMRSVLQRWNEETFMEKGFEAWLALPFDGELLAVDPPTGDPKKWSEKRRAKRQARRFKIVIATHQELPWVPPAYSESAESSDSDASIPEKS